MNRRNSLRPGLALRALREVRGVPTRNDRVQEGRVLVLGERHQIHLLLALDNEDVLTSVTLGFGCSRISGKSPRSMWKTIGGSALTQPEAKMRSRATIQIDVFSGRPNPSWTLEEASAGELLSKLKSTRRTAPVPMPDGLGFRGFRVTVSDGSHDREFQIFGSRIQEGQQSYLDPDRSVERFVVSTMPADLKNDFADILPQQ